ncbi:Uma2 family endonuclease [Nocardia arthritidis]|uniref:Uma2 family endonuclease n=1 Tax=Nocardia arthritidis TaxID=228602 RepID=A0A6G9YB38_9NOCA|nr:Uma2 family endonuclease [Nocardia arthritidis]QIS10276.1 Uma2 family endonuclease [Nocardia arthritidis]
MTAVEEGRILTTEFESIARAVERETEGVLVEFIDGKLGVKGVPDGDHNRILNWLLMTLMPLHPALFLHIAGQGLAVGAYRRGRARPDGVLAPPDAFVGAGEWASADQAVMVVEVTSPDSDSNRRDRCEKPIAYADASIPIYLLIDRDSAEVVVHSQPSAGRYQDVHRYAFGLEVALPEPVGVTLDTEPLKNWID